MGPRIWRREAARESGVEAEAGVILGIAKDEYPLPTTLSRKVESRADQSRPDAGALAFRHHRNRRKSKRTKRSAHSREKDVSDKLVSVESDKRDHAVAVRTQPIDEHCFVRSPEGCGHHAMDGGSIGRLFASHYHSGTKLIEAVPARGHFKLEAP